MRTYEIKHEPITVEGKQIDKYNIYYYIDSALLSKEFHSTDGVNGFIRDGFKKTNESNWAALRLGLMTSKAFVRILSNQDSVNMVAYVALQTILSTESNEQHLLQMLKLTMAYTDAEKSEINDIFEKNNFTIRL